jgi:hypothetical protein
MELAARIANLAWALHVRRAGARTAVERFKEMEAAGLVHNDVWFARLAGQPR